MIANIISTGNEVLIGDIIDTNSSYLARRLTQMGVTVKAVRTVADDIQDICDTIKQSSRDAALCLVTGGLGPTSDDVTALACARAAGVELKMDQSALEHMKKYFEKRKFELTPENEKQAMLPEFSIPLNNDNGTAPGFCIKINKCQFFFMPGVPHEMKQMFDQQVVQALKKEGVGSDQIKIERLTVFGMGESKVGALLKGFKGLFPGLSIGFRAAFPVIEVKIISSGDPKENAASMLPEARKWIMAQLKDKVISTRGLSMAQEVGRLLTEQGKTVAVAESCTGGLIANWLTDVSGSSDYFLFSGVTYSNDAKIKVLGVKESTIMAFGAVHEQTALEMAAGAKKKAGADYAISTTGIAGPTGGSIEKPVGMVCIGFAGPLFAKAKTYLFTSGDRHLNKQMFAATALNQLRRQLVSTSETF